jgi:hypothetical protein
MKCTLWEDFGLQFQNYMNNRTEWGPTIIVIHNGKIKEATGHYIYYYVYHTMFLFNLQNYSKCSLLT